MTDEQMSDLVAQIPRIAKLVGRMVDYNLPEYDDLISQIICDTLEFVKSGKFRGESQIGTVAHTIARRRVFDHYRRNYKTINGPEYVTVMEPSQIAPCVQLEMRRKIKFAMKQIPNLPPRKSEIIRKIYIDGMSISDAAAEMSIAERTAKAYVQSGLRRLRKIVLAAWRDK